MGDLTVEAMCVSFMPQASSPRERQAKGREPDAVRGVAQAEERRETLRREIDAQMTVLAHRKQGRGLMGFRPLGFKAGTSG